MLELLPRPQEIQVLFIMLLQLQLLLLKLLLMLVLLLLLKAELLGAQYEQLVGILELPVALLQSQFGRLLKMNIEEQN